MLTISMQLFRELEADFSGSTVQGYSFHSMGDPTQLPHRNRLRYYTLKKAVEAARHIRVMAAHQTVLIFTGQHNEH